ncbi:MAG: 2-phosphosulfolactate phosphatase [Cytophagales bacterium]|nr:2-phosphosulfolactate phosphatase [Cytophagales bacterium]
MKKKIEVCFSPELLDLFDLEGKAVVVVDVLRATSCMVTGLAEGVKAIRPVMQVEECLQLMEKGYLGAGERGGVKIEAFDLGNSPFGYMEERCKGRKIAVTTTNGTLAIEKSRGAKVVLIGAFLNLKAVADFLKHLNLDAVIVCAGWKGRVNLEDSLFAGALAAQLEETFATSCDSVLMAKTLWRNAEGRLENVVGQSAHVERLKNIGIGEDLEFCTAVDRYHGVPVLEGKELVLADVRAGG